MICLNYMYLFSMQIFRFLAWKISCRAAARVVALKVPGERTPSNLDSIAQLCNLDSDSNFKKSSN